MDRAVTVPPLTYDVLKDVAEERGSQDMKWGVQDHDPLAWLAILTEEVGEVAKEVNEVHFRGKSGEAYRAELIQVAAVAVAMVECVDRDRLLQEQYSSPALRDT
jgi:NTP pyrophosphatase (non-canonical NTP hydrolase)